MRRLVYTIVLCLFFSGLVWGFPLYKTFAWWHNLKIKKELDLKPSQIEKMDNIFKEFIERQKGLKLDLRKKWRDLDNLFLEGKADKIKKLEKEIIAIQEKLLQNRIDMKIKIWRLLSSEQRKIILEKFPYIAKFSSSWIKSSRSRRGKPFPFIPATKKK